MDWADWGGRGGQGRIADEGGQAGLGGEGRTGRTGRRAEEAEGGVWGGKPQADVPVDWVDRLGRGRLGRLAFSHLRADEIRNMLSPDADYGVIWLHILGIHIRFFRAHIVVIFLGTDTSKAQRTSPDDKFFASLGALNIMYSICHSRRRNRHL